MKRNRDESGGRKKKSKNNARKNKLKSKKKSNNRGKGNRKRQKKRQKKRLTKQSSCTSTEVSLTCMTNAMEGMKFEKNQITNYLKQAKRLENHGSISTNKLGKQDNFLDAKKHLLWAIGGNFSDPKCGPNSTAEKTALVSKLDQHL